MNPAADGIRATGPCPAAAQPPCPRSARAPPCGRDCWAARRHFQPTCRSSPRGRPRKANHTTAARKTLAIRTPARTRRPGFQANGRQRSPFRLAGGSASGIGTVARHQRIALRTFETADARIGLMAKTAVLPHQSVCLVRSAHPYRNCWISEAPAGSGHHDGAAGEDDPDGDGGRQEASAHVPAPKRRRSCADLPGADAFRPAADPGAAVSGFVAPFSEWRRS